MPLVSLLINLGLRAYTQKLLEHNICLFLRSVLGESYWHPVTQFREISANQSGPLVFYQCEVETNRGTQVVDFVFVFVAVQTDDKVELFHVQVETDDKVELVLPDKLQCTEQSLVPV
jgi:hypothetical protein